MIYPGRRVYRPAETADAPPGGVLEGRRGMVEDPFAFAGMREYDGTDPMNRINWKASARSGNLMVNLQNSTYSPRVACFVDVEDVTM